MNFLSKLVSIWQNLDIQVPSQYPFSYSFWALKPQFCWRFQHAQPKLHFTVSFAQLRETNWLMKCSWKLFCRASGKVPETEDWLGWYAHSCIGPSYCRIRCLELHQPWCKHVHLARLLRWYSRDLGKHWLLKRLWSCFISSYVRGK